MNESGKGHRRNRDRHRLARAPGRSISRPSEEKLPLLISLLSRIDAQRSIVFVNTKIAAEKVTRRLERQGFTVAHAVRRRAADEARAPARQVPAAAKSKCWSRPTSPRAACISPTSATSSTTTCRTTPKTTCTASAAPRASAPRATRSALPATCTRWACPTSRRISARRFRSSAIEPELLVAPPRGAGAPAPTAGRATTDADDASQHGRRTAAKTADRRDAPARNRRAARDRGRAATRNPHAHRSPSRREPAPPRVEPRRRERSTTGRPLLPMRRRKRRRRGGRGRRVVKAAIRRRRGQRQERRRTTPNRRASANRVASGRAQRQSPIRRASPSARTHRRAHRNRACSVASRRPVPR